MNLRPALSLVLACAACSADDQSAGSADASADASAPCDPLIAVPLGRGTALGSVPIGERLAVLLRRDPDLMLVTIDANGTTSEVKVGSGGSGAGSLAVDPGGNACVAWVGSQARVQVACAPAWQESDSGLKAERTFGEASCRTTRSCK